ncbi:SDR family NAD(P)-dependent oxidoreductase [Pseudomonadota bacterium]
MSTPNTVLITGGTGGVGLTLVRCFAQRGDKVIFTYNSSKTKCDALLKELVSHDITGLFFNQGDWQSHQQLMKALPDKIDVLVNNAALGSATVENRSPDLHEQDRLLLEVNALGPLWLTRDVLAIMKRSGAGKIINFSSVGGGISQFPGFRLADGMSKAAIAHMTKQLAAELVHDPIDIFAICPGATNTGMFEASTLSHMTAEQRQSFIKALPKGRLIEPEEIAELCLFLASEHSQIMHGAVIDASLGLGTNPACLSK